MTTRPIVQVRSDDDLQLPLMQAIADAEKSGADTLTVRIAAGKYRGGLSLSAPTKPEKLGFVVEPDGAGRVELGGGISIQGKTVTLRGVILDGVRPSGIALSLRAYETLEVDNVALVGVRLSGGGGERDPLVDLVARAKGARAKLHDLWVVDCTAATVIRVPVNGPGRWANVELANAVFAGNHAKVGLDVLGTDAFAIADVFAAEPALADEWLQLGTFGSIAIKQSTIAVRNGLIGHRGDDKYPKVAVGDSELLGPKSSEPVDAKTVTWGKPPAAALDTKPFAAAARANQPPDRTKLRALLP